jgi:hypothetical protein
MPTECSAKPVGSARVDGRAVAVDVDGGAITSHAGGLLLGAADRGIGPVERLAGCFIDGQVAQRVVHATSRHWWGSGCSASRSAMRARSSIRIPLAWAEHDVEATGRPAGRFADFRWTTKAELEPPPPRRRPSGCRAAAPGGADARLLVTSPKPARADARTLCEQMTFTSLATWP